MIRRQFVPPKKPREGHQDRQPHRETSQSPSKGEASHKIQLEKENIALLLNRQMNYSVLAQRPFILTPTSFISQIEGLKPRSFSFVRQLQWIEDFLDNPWAARSHCIVSAPHDGQAKLLAAWMMQYALVNNPDNKALPLWHDLFQGFDNPLMKDRSGASLLVFSNIGQDSTPTKLEKLRDLLEFYSDVPKIVVATGCDPFQFFTRKLYLPIHSVTYLTNSLVKKTLEV